MTKTDVLCPAIGSCNMLGPIFRETAGGTLDTQTRPTLHNPYPGGWMEVKVSIATDNWKSMHGCDCALRSRSVVGITRDRSQTRSHPDLLSPNPESVTLLELSSPTRVRMSHYKCTFFWEMIWAYKAGTNRPCLPSTSTTITTTPVS